MEMVKTATIAAQLEGFSRLPRAKQAGLIFGVAAIVVASVLVLLWSQEPSYDVLYSNLENKDAGEVVEALKTEGIGYKLNGKDGSILVPAARVHETRIKMAVLGLPRGGNAGFELLDEKSSGFGVSQFMENARYNRALEGELSRSISSIEGVVAARVHLAIPKQSVFVREREKPTASVVVNLAQGGRLDQKQVDAIVHLVASSIPALTPETVTVVDQGGRLLSTKERSPEMELNDRQFAFSRRVEKTYIDRIENILQPIVGPNGVRAQVVADVDFTVTEQTQELYNPDQAAVRSEQRQAEQTVGQNESGIPGALSNEPPGETQVPEQINGGGADKERKIRSKSRATINYEVDRTISHTRNPTGGVRRLSVAVVVDDHQRSNEDGTSVSVPRNDDEMARITALVKEAVGFNLARGDSVNVINAAFIGEEAMVELALWEQPWFWDIAKQVIGASVVLFLVFIILKPILRNLAQVPEPLTEEEQELTELERQKNRMQQELEREIQVADYETNLQTAKNLAKQDPKRVATVVRAWVLGGEVENM